MTSSRYINKTYTEWICLWYVFTNSECQCQNFLLQSGAWHTRIRVSFEVVRRDTPNYLWVGENANKVTWLKSARFAGIFFLMWSQVYPRQTEPVGAIIQYTPVNSNTQGTICSNYRKNKNSGIICQNSLLRRLGCNLLQFL